MRLDLDDYEGASGPAGDGISPESGTEGDILGLVGAIPTPVVWIGGSEPLSHSAVGRLAGRIVNCGRTVFVETDGFHLRQRIHEFQPVSRLYLTLKFYRLQHSSDSWVGRQGAFGRAIEGIRAAKLSGFLICGHVLVDAGTDLNEVAQMRNQLVEMDADGLFVSAAPGTGSATKEDTQSKVQEARKIVESHGWGTLGRMLDRESQEAQARRQRPSTTDRILQPAADEQEEGVEVR